MTKGKQRGIEVGAAFSSLHEQEPMMPHITLTGNKNIKRKPKFLYKGGVVMGGEEEEQEVLSVTFRFRTQGTAWLGVTLTELGKCGKGTGLVCRDQGFWCGYC